MTISPKVYAWIGTLLLICAFFWSSFDHPVLEMDEGMLLAYPEQLANGKLPYRDFETFYTPGNIYFLSGIYSVFGYSIEVERSVGLLYRLAIISALMVMIQRRSLTLAICGGLICALTMKPTHLFAFAWWGGVSFAIWAVAVMTSGYRHRAWIAGFLAGAALFFRQDLGPALIISCMPCWLLLGKRDRWYFVAAAAAALSPLAVITISVGLKATFENLVLYPVFIGNPGRRLPINSFGPAFVVIFWMMIFCLILNTVAGIVEARRGRGTSDSRMLLSLALLGLAITHQAFQRFDIMHVPFAIFVTLAIAPLSASSLIRSLFSVQVKPWQELAFALVLTGAFVANSMTNNRLRSSYLFTSLVYSLPLEIRGRTVPMVAKPTSEQLHKIGRILDKQSRPGDRLFVGPGDLRCAFATDTYLYHLFPWLQPASYFMEMNPLSANRKDSRLAEDIETADWVILNRLWDVAREDNQSRVLGPDAPNEVIRSQFIVRSDGGMYVLYERKNHVQATHSALSTN